MMLTYLSVLGIIFAVGVAAAGYFIYKANRLEIERPQRLITLLYIGLGINAAILIISLISPGSAFLLLFFPANLYVFTQTVLHLRTFPQMVRREKALAAALAASQAFLIYLLWMRPEGLSIYLLPGVFLAIVWSVVHRSRVIDAAAVVVFAGSVLLSSWIIESMWNPTAPEWLYWALFFLRSGLFTLMVVLPTALIYNALKPGTGKHIVKKLIRFGLAGLLPLVYGYILYWSAIWDNTNDGLGAVFLFLFAIPIAVASGSLLAARLPKTQRWTGYTYFIVFILLLNFAMQAHWQVSYQQITVDRAERVSNALEQYYARVGQYPARLQDLSPRDLLFIPQPIIIRGEGWCYQADMHSYRLGTFYREYFSLPVSVRIYESAGQTFDTPWECDLRLPEVRDRHPGFQ
jgi:ABC-type antimicrobial peptide transport system permease subunit